MPGALGFWVSGSGCCFGSCGSAVGRRSVFGRAKWRQCILPSADLLPGASARGSKPAGASPECPRHGSAPGDPVAENGGVIRAAALSAGFAAVRLRFRPAGGRGDVFDKAAAYSCVTSVTRVPEEQSTRMRDAVGSIAGIDRHYVYPPTDLHRTIANLDASPLDPDDLVKRVADAVAGAAPFEVRLRGLAITSQSIYAQAWDMSGGLRRVRECVQDAAGIRLPLMRRTLGFVNLARFRERDVQALRAGIGRFARADFGAFTVGTVEIVRTDKVFAADRTRVLGVGRLRGV